LKPAATIHHRPLLPGTVPVIAYIVQGSSHATGRSFHDVMAEPTLCAWASWNPCSTTRSCASTRLVTPRRPLDNRSRRRRSSVDVRQTASTTGASGSPVWSRPFSTINRPSSAVISSAWSAITLPRSLVILALAAEEGGAWVGSRGRGLSDRARLVIRAPRQRHGGARRAHAVLLVRAAAESSGRGTQPRRRCRSMRPNLGGVSDGLQLVATPRLGSAGTSCGVSRAARGGGPRPGDSPPSHLTRTFRLPHSSQLQTYSADRTWSPAGQVTGAAHLTGRKFRSVPGLDSVQAVRRRGLRNELPPRQAPCLSHHVQRPAKAEAKTPRWKLLRMRRIGVPGSVPILYGGPPPISGSGV